MAHSFLSDTFDGKRLFRFLLDWSSVKSTDFPPLLAIYNDSIFVLNLNNSLSEECTMVIKDYITLGEGVYMYN